MRSQEPAAVMASLGFGPLLLIKSFQVPTDRCCDVTYAYVIRHAIVWYAFVRVHISCQWASVCRQCNRRYVVCRSTCAAAGAASWRTSFPRSHPEARPSWTLAARPLPHGQRWRQQRQRQRQSPTPLRQRPRCRRLQRWHCRLQRLPSKQLARLRQRQ